MIQAKLYELDESVRAEPWVRSETFAEDAEETCRIYGEIESLEFLHGVQPYAGCLAGGGVYNFYTVFRREPGVSRWLLFTRSLFKLVTMLRQARLSDDANSITSHIRSMESTIPCTLANDCATEKSSPVSAAAIEPGMFWA